VHSGLHADGVDIEPHLFAADAISLELTDVQEPEVDRLVVGAEFESHEVVVCPSAVLDFVDQKILPWSRRPGVMSTCSSSSNSTS
jgi:hypothetical protein